MGRRSLLLLLLALFPQPVSAESCRFEYWQVIAPATSCELYVLPDFSFRKVEHLPTEPETSRRFCTPYLISSKQGEERVSYCYTGEGLSTGPIFTVGKQRYVANFGFEGCRGATPVQGLVFHPAFGTPAAARAPLRPIQRQNFKDPIRCD